MAVNTHLLMEEHALYGKAWSSVGCEVFDAETKQIVAICPTSGAEHPKLRAYYLAHLHNTVPKLVAQINELLDALSEGNDVLTDRDIAHEAAVGKLDQRIALLRQENKHLDEERNRLERLLADAQGEADRLANQVEELEAALDTACT